MPGRRAGRADAVVTVAAGVVAVYVTVRVVRWAGRVAARLAADVAHAAPWIGLGGIGALVLVVAVTGDRRARRLARIEHRPAEVPEVPPVAEPARRPVPAAVPSDCAYGPACPRCTGTGTIGLTALDHPPADDRPAVEPVPLHPARRPRGRPRKVA